MKIILWLGNEANQKALANKIHADFPVSAIVIESRKSKSKMSVSRLLGALYNKVFLRVIDDAWFGMKKHYEATFPSWPETDIVEVENIHDQITIDLFNKYKPDLILVSGTRLIKEPLISLKPGVGILNLHTGLSPYIKGGPNCTNWCIATGQYNMIGNTIMWLDEGIDTGDLFLTETCKLNYEKTLKGVHIQVMEQAHDLYLKALQLVSTAVLVRIPQSSIAKGKTYYSKQWGIRNKMKLVKNLKSFLRTLQIQEKDPDIITVDPENLNHFKF